VRVEPVVRARSVHPAISGQAPWQSAAREYIEQVHQHYGDRLSAVVLFGSRARGDDDEGSDVDLLVVLSGTCDQDVEQRVASELARRLEEKYDYPLLGSIVATDDDYRRRMLPLFMNIRHEGIVIWPAEQKTVRDEHVPYDERAERDVELVLELMREALADAQSGLEQDRSRWAANRAYFAMFHAATALLLKDGLSFSRHRGVISAFNQRLVKNRRFPRELGSQLSVAFEARNAADYGYREQISLDVVADLVRGAERFVAETERILGS
jgi:hypothetical protein